MTGDEGPLVKSHIIPKALTTFAEKGRPVAQAGTDYAPVKRWDGWYGAMIVTLAGEDILCAIGNGPSLFKPCRQPRVACGNK